MKLDIQLLTILTIVGLYFYILLEAARIMMLDLTSEVEFRIRHSKLQIYILLWFALLILDRFINR